MGRPEGRQLTTNCPHCGVKVCYVPDGDNPYFPFCSRRCKLIDLGKWLEEEHRIEGPLNDRMPSSREEENDGDG